MELLAWSVRLWGLALILFTIDVFFYDCYVIFLKYFFHVFSQKKKQKTKKKDYN